MSTDVFDDLEQLVEPVALLAGVLDEVAGADDDGATFGSPRGGDAAATAEIE